MAHQRPLHAVLVALGSSGDVHPFIGVGRELARRGHTVTLVAAGWFRDVVERVGLRFVDPLPDMDFAENIRDERLWHPLHGARLVLEMLGRQLLEPIYRIVERTSFADRAAGRRTVVTASTLAFGARVARERLGVPLVTLHLSPMLVRSLEDPPRIPGLLVHRGPRWFRRLQWCLGDTVLDMVIRRWLGPFRAGLGLPPVRRLFRDWIHSPDATLGMFPDWFGPSLSETPLEIELVGFPLYSEEGASAPTPELMRWVAEGTPPLLFTPGSANVYGHAFFAAAADACSRLGRRGLLLTRFPEQIPPVLPQGVRHVDFVPFRWLVPRSAALVHHGGIGTLSQGLAGGVPQVVMPMGFDQFDNAARLERLGVGIGIARRAFRGPLLATTLGRFLGDAAMAARCREVAERLETNAALATVADRVESVAERESGTGGVNTPSGSHSIAASRGS